MELSKSGLECFLVERKSLPRTKACGSGLSPWTLRHLDAMGVGSRVRAQAYRIDGALIAGSDGRGLELRGDHETAILRRSEFDYILVQEAVRRGVRLMDATQVRSITTVENSMDKVEVAIETSNGTLEADLVIDCSGATGQLQRRTSHEGSTDQAGSSDLLFGSRMFSSQVPGSQSAYNFVRRVSARIKSERVVLHTIMGWYEGVAGCSDLVELFFDQELRPHYAWIFPETKDRVNIGLCFLKRPGGENAREHFEAFLERRLKHRLKHAEQLGRWIGHPVQVSTAAQDLVSTGILRAGEAGWLADAATAEGIYHALVSGGFAGKFAAERLLARGSRRRLALLPYQTRVQRGLLGRLALGRALMGALQMPTLDWALAMKSSPVTQKALSRAFTGLYHG